MMIVGVMMFEAKLELAAVKRIIASRSSPTGASGQKAVQDATGAWWEEDADFDLDSHVHRTGLPGRGGKAELEAFRERPCLPRRSISPGRSGSFHVVDNYEGGQRPRDPHPPLLRRRHRARAGAALAHACHGRGQPRDRDEEIDTADTADADFWARSSGPSRAPSRTRVASARLAAGPAFAATRRPAGETLQGALGKGLGFAGEIAKLATMGQDSATRFQGRARRAKARGLGRSPAAGRGEGDGPGARLGSMPTEDRGTRGRSGCRALPSHRGAVTGTTARMFTRPRVAVLLE